ncbi:MAG: hypothetical protein EPN36_14190 [Rhodanobacteraceae bacterium]|nr:MAG: hypothetical protein EPN36_14190 [Rhodanobacteraceae bacterium]
MFAAIFIAAIAFAIWAYFTLFKLLLKLAWWVLKTLFHLRPKPRRSKTIAYRIDRLVAAHNRRVARARLTREREAALKA